MGRHSTVTLVVVALALGLVSGAAPAPWQPSGALQLKTTITLKWRLDREYCPPGTPSVADCLRAVGEREIAGLGRMTVTLEKVLPGNDPSCFMVQNNTTLVEVAGKGTLVLSRPGRICASGPPPRVDGPYEFSVASGTGRYAGATGTLVERTAVGPGNPVCACGTATTTWTGTLTVPGVEFDLTPPVLTGAVSKTVHAPKGAKRVRVRFEVTAKDAVDGSRPLACTPRSGSFFKLGRTRVTCSAKDSSANTRRVRFSITVKRWSR
jgi:hypothetical protein